MRVVAIDWSGRRARAAEFIWAAEVRDRRLVDLRNGRTPDDIVECIAHGDPRSVVGLDFAFQVGGAGAVGTGSMRGMPWLLALARQGFSVHELAALHRDDDPLAAIEGTIWRP